MSIANWDLRVRKVDRDKGHQLAREFSGNMCLQRRRKAAPALPLFELKIGFFLRKSAPPGPAAQQRDIWATRECGDLSPLYDKWPPAPKVILSQPTERAETLKEQG